MINLADRQTTIAMPIEVVRSFAINPRLNKHTNVPNEAIWINHGHYIDLLEEQLSILGVVPHYNWYTVFKEDRSVLFGNYDFTIPTDPLPELPFAGTYSLVVYHSHCAKDGYFSKLYLGARDYETGIGVCAYCVSLSPSQRYINDWRGLVFDGSRKLLKKIGAVSLMVNYLREVQITDAQASQAFTALTQGVMASQQLRTAVRHYFEPQYEVIKDRTLWSLYVACMLGGFTYHPQNQLKKMTKLRQAMLPTFDERIIELWPYS